MNDQQSNLSDATGAPVRTTWSFRRKGQPARQRLERMLDIALEDSFPCSDPISSLRCDR